MRKRNFIFILAVFNLLLGGFNVSSALYGHMLWLGVFGFLAAMIGGVFPLLSIIGRAYTEGYQDGMPEGAYQFYKQILLEIGKVRKPKSEVPETPAEL